MAVTLTDVKDFARIETDADDTILQTMLGAAVDHVQAILGPDTSLESDRPRLIIMSLTAHWYEARTPTEGNAREVPHHITRLLNTTRTWEQQ